MFTNLERELKMQKGRLSKKSPIREQIDSLAECKLLEESEAAKDARIMRALGSNHILSIEDDKYTKRYELKVLDDMYNGGVYSEEQIKSICVKYRLRFLTTKYFKGHISVKTLLAIKKFCKEADIELNEGTASSQFYIMAPPNEFNLTERKAQGESMLNYRVRMFLENFKDPALFYNIGSGKYRLVRKWGVMFTIFRLIQGFKWKNLTTLFIYTLTLWLAVGYALFHFFWHWDKAWKDPNEPHDGWHLLMVIFFAVCFIGPIIIAAVRRSKYSYESGSPREGFFTSSNWNSSILTTL